MAKQSAAAINSSSVAEDIKQQLKDLTRSLAKISPLITEIKSAYHVKTHASDLCEILDHFENRNYTWEGWSS